ETLLEPLQSIPQSVGPAGVEPAFHRVSDGCLAARLRPDQSALYGNRTRLTCSTDRLARQLHHRAEKSAWREANPPVRHGEPVPGPLGHRRISEHEQQGRKDPQPSDEQPATPPWCFGASKESGQNRNRT